MTAEIRYMARNNNPKLLQVWIKTNPRSLAMARIKVSFEDTMRVLERIDGGSQSAQDGKFYTESHSRLLKRMIEKGLGNHSRCKTL